MIKRLIAAGILAASFAVPAFAQDKAELSPATIEQLDVAARLTNYGIARNDPLLLLAAARMLTAMSAEAAAPAPAMSAADLVAKARELAEQDAGLAAVIEAVEGETSRGLCHGPGTVYGCF